MSDTVPTIQIETAGEDELYSFFAELQTSGTIKHIKPILARIPSLSDKKLKKRGLAAASGILKRTLFHKCIELDDKSQKSLTQLLKTIDSSVFSSISNTLKSPDNNARLNALLILKHMGKKEQIFSAVKELLSDDNPRIRATAVSILIQSDINSCAF